MTSYVWAITTDHGHGVHSLYATKAAADEAMVYVGSGPGMLVEEFPVADRIDPDRFVMVYRATSIDDQSPIETSFWDEAIDSDRIPYGLAYKAGGRQYFEGFGFSSYEAVAQLEQARKSVLA